MVVKFTLTNKGAKHYLGEKVSPKAIQRNLHYVISDEDGTRSVGKNRYTGFCYREIKVDEIKLGSIYG